MVVQETIPIVVTQKQTIFEAIIQIHLFPTVSIEALGVDQKHNSLNEALLK